MKAQLVFLWIICIVLAMPLYLMVMNSFTPVTLGMRFPPDFLPFDFTLSNYRAVFENPMVPIWTWNLIWISISTMAGAVIINALAGYVFCFGKFRFKEVLFVALVAPIFVTRYTIIISQFVVFSALKLRGFAAVIAVQLLNPMQIYLARNFFRAIPMSVVETAKLDGASDWTILMRIVLPMSKSLIGAMMAFLGLSIMGDFIWQMLNLQLPKTKTLLVGLVQSALGNNLGRNIGYGLAVGVILFIPYFIIFGASSRYFIKGLKFEVER